MTKNLHVGSIGIAAIGNERSKLAEPSGSPERPQAPEDREDRTFLDARPKLEGSTPRLSKGVRPSSSRDVSPNLDSNCPICGDPYQPSEGIVGLDCLSFATSSLPPLPAA